MTSFGNSFSIATIVATSAVIFLQARCRSGCRRCRGGRLGAAMPAAQWPAAGRPVATTVVPNTPVVARARQDRGARARAVR